MLTASLLSHTGYRTSSWRMDSKRSSSLSASKGGWPAIISYISTPRAHQSTDGPYSSSCKICKGQITTKRMSFEAYNRITEDESTYSVLIWREKPAVLSEVLQPLMVITLNKIWKLWISECNEKLRLNRKWKTLKN